MFRKMNITPFNSQTMSWTWTLMTITLTPSRTWKWATVTRKLLETNLQAMQTKTWMCSLICMKGSNKTQKWVMSTLIVIKSRLRKAEQPSLRTFSLISCLHQIRISNICLLMSSMVNPNRSINRKETRMETNLTSSIKKDSTSSIN